MARRKRKITTATSGDEVLGKEDLPEPGETGWCDEVDRIICTYKSKIKNPLTAIRAFCVECHGGSAVSVTDCMSHSCSLYPFRMGKNTMHGLRGVVPKSAIRKGEKRGR